MVIISLTYIKSLEEVDALLEERHISPIIVQKKLNNIRSIQ